MLQTARRFEFDILISARNVTVAFALFCNWQPIRSSFSTNERTAEHDWIFPDGPPEPVHSVPLKTCLASTQGRERKVSIQVCGEYLGDSCISVYFVFQSYLQKKLDLGLIIYVPLLWKSKENCKKFPFFLFYKWENLGKTWNWKFSW